MFSSFPKRPVSCAAAASASHRSFLHELARRTQLPGHAQQRIHVFSGTSENDPRFRFDYTLHQLRTIDPNLKFYDPRLFTSAVDTKISGPILLIDDDSYWLEPQEWKLLPAVSEKVKPALNTTFLGIVAGQQIEMMRELEADSFDMSQIRIGAFTTGAYKLFELPVNTSAVYDAFLEGFTHP